MNKLSELLLDFTFIAELTGLLFSLILLRIATGFWRLLIWYIGFVVVVEIFGWFLRINDITNQWLYNVFLIASTSFYFYILRKILKDSNTNKVLIISVFFFGVFASVNVLFGQGFFVFNNYTLLAASGIIIILSLVFYRCIFNNPNASNLAVDENFWLINGLFLFHLGIVFWTIFQGALSSLYKKTGFNYSRFIIQFINVIFYSCLIVSFYLKSKAIRRESNAEQVL